MVERRAIARQPLDVWRMAGGSPPLNHRLHLNRYFMVFAVLSGSFLSALVSLALELLKSVSKKSNC